ncbi:MAG: putative glycosidase [Acidimicrobiaceae bacterium]|nr:putative glycosidase [Acidimicrobiaceae bacterium]
MFGADDGHRSCEMTHKAGPHGGDLLVGVRWWCKKVPAGSVVDPALLDALPSGDGAGSSEGEGLGGWIPAQVPGTVGSALRRAGYRGSLEDLDESDWWYACELPELGEGPLDLRLDGLATYADLWIDGERLLSSDNMFVAHEIALEGIRPGARLAVRFGALAPQLRVRRARPRWKATLVRQQSLRFVRTALIGRVPGLGGTAPVVGPYRAAVLTRRARLQLAPGARLAAHLEGEIGVVEATIELSGTALGELDGANATFSVGGDKTPITLRQEAGKLGGTVRTTVASPRRWCPHTHGRPERYPVSVEVAGERLEMGAVGFRDIALHREDGAFRLVVNGEAVFVRGACWVPPNPLEPGASGEETRSRLEALLEANLNLVRITGTLPYADDCFFRECDELGMLVWQDLPFGPLDPPEDAEFTAVLADELTRVLGPLASHPSLAVVCGSEESEQQAAMMGLSVEHRRSELLERAVPALLEEILPTAVYVSSSPTGGAFAFHPREGLSHYFGVGAYRRPLEDVRLAGVRFASQCLGFSIPPERSSVSESFAGANGLGGREWWEGTPRDPGRSWDFADVTDHYVASLFAEDPRALRTDQPERYLDLQRAATALACASVFAQLRRPESRCGGAIHLAAGDLAPGPGFGLLDSLGVPKAPWYTMRRVLAPSAVCLLDEGLNGLDAHLYNDGDALEGELVVRLASTERVLEEVRRSVALPARSAIGLSVEELLGGFRDLTWAYRFGPKAYQAVEVELRPADGRPQSRDVYLVGGLPIDLSPVPAALQAELVEDADGSPAVRISSGVLTCFLAVEAENYVPKDNWFHLLPGTVRTVALAPRPGSEAPRGEVRALNALSPATFGYEQP